jgi:hypothetical protein
MEKVNKEFDNAIKDSNTLPCSSNTSNVAKYDEYLKDIKNKKNIKLKYLKDFLNSFHSGSSSSGKNNQQTPSLVLSESVDVVDKKNTKETEPSLNIKLNSELLDDLKSRKESKASNTAGSNKKHRNSTAIPSSTSGSLAHHSSVNSAIDLEYLTRKLESLQKSNSAYSLTPVQSSTSPIIKSSTSTINTPAKSSTNPSASVTIATTGGSKSKKLADLYLNDYKLNKITISGNGKKENRPLSNLDQHHYYNIGKFKA